MKPLAASSQRASQLHPPLRAQPLSKLSCGAEFELAFSPSHHWWPLPTSKKPEDPRDSHTVQVSWDPDTDSGIKRCPYPPPHPHIRPSVVPASNQHLPGDLCVRQFRVLCGALHLWKDVPTGTADLPGAWRRGDLSHPCELRLAAAEGEGDMRAGTSGSRGDADGGPQGRHRGAQGGARAHPLRGGPTGAGRPVKVGQGSEPLWAGHRH